MFVLCAVGEGRPPVDGSGEGPLDCDTLALGPGWAGLLGDGERLRKDLKRPRMADGERNRLLFFCGWLDMSWSESSRKQSQSGVAQTGVRDLFYLTRYLIYVIISVTNFREFILFTLLISSCANTPHLSVVTIVTYF